MQRARFIIDIETYIDTDINGTIKEYVEHVLDNSDVYLLKITEETYLGDGDDT